MKSLGIFGLGAVLSGIITFVISSDAKIGLLASAEFTILVALMLLLLKAFKRTVSPYVLCAISLLIVTLVSISASEA